MNESKNHSHLLRVFLCHSSGDKEAVRDLYRRLCAEGIEPWFDEENLLPGQDWNQKISKAVRTVDVVIVCLSQGSINKRGYVQKEIKYALDVADEQPEDTIFLIPLRLEPCVIPDRLSRWQCVNLFEEKGFDRLMKSLRQTMTARGLGDEELKKDKTRNFLSLNVESIEEKHVYSLLEILRTSREQVYWVRLDEEATIIEASDSFMELLGLSRENMIGAQIMDLVVPPEVERMQRRFAYKEENKKAIYYFTKIQHKQYGAVNVIAYAFPILNDGMYVGSIGILIPMEGTEPEHFLATVHHS